MNLLVLIINLIPALIAAIKAIELAVPGQGQGEQKLLAIQSILEVADESYALVWPKIKPVVGVLVNLFNKTGTFPVKE